MYGEKKEGSKHINHSDVSIHSRFLLRKKDTVYSSIVYAALRD